jgi:hypothetical protein
MRYLALLAVILTACGSSDRTSPNVSVDGGRDTGDGGPSGTMSLTGTVWAPGNAPGMVPAGNEIPVYNALVYLSTERPAPIPQVVYCEECTAGPQNAVSTDHKGNFTIPGAPVGEVKWLVIQKGQFRLEQQITVGEDLRALPANMTTLPGQNDPTEGKWTPRIALASGSFDPMQDILGKLSFGGVDGSGSFVSSSAAGHFDVYSNGGSVDSLAMGTLTQLVSNLELMKSYHIIFIPCASSANTSALTDQQNLRNMRDYVKAGGRLYVADWSGEWMDMVFPRQIELNGAGIDTPGDAYDPDTDTWNTSLMGSANGGFYNSDAEVVDPDMFQWIDGQSGPGGTFDAAALAIEDNWNIIRKVNSVEVGTDEQGMPVIDEPKVYVIGDNPTFATKQPLTVTFEPAGCGRVLYTTYHTNPGTHVGLDAQERLLAYLLMEIGVCKSGPVVE